MAATNASPKDSVMTLKKQLDDLAALSKGSQDAFTRKRLHHFSHISTDSVTTADDDDFSDRHGHRRCFSGTESLSSDLTEFAEPAICRDHRDTNGDMDMDMSSPSPSMSAHSPTPLYEPWGMTSYFAYNAQGQQQPHHHQQQQPQLYNVHSNNYGRRDEGSTDAFDNISSPRAISSRHSLASILTTNLTGSSSSSLSSSAQYDTFDLKNHFSVESMEVIDSGSSASSPLTSEFHRQQLDDPSGIMERSLPDLEKKKILARLFSRAASNGDRVRMQDMLEHFRDWIDLDAQDEDGTSPLIYAACFGHVEIASMLLEAGAVVDARDKFGWTALVWATNNKHDNMVRLLLEQGASTSAQTVKGHTIVDFLRHDPNDNSKIVQIFQEPCRRDSSSIDGYSTGNDPFCLSGVDESKGTPAHSNDQRVRTTSEGAHVAFNVSMASLRKADQLDDEGDFDWDRCLPDQMFVFSSMDISHIINATVTTMEPTRVRPYKPVPAYVLFLAARFAHHYSTSGLLDELLDATTRAISDVTRSRPEDMTLAAYWISNASALLCFLRKDSGLSGASKLHRARIERLIEEMVQLLVLDAERRIEGILEPAMLDHDTIAGLDEVKFQSDWAFWRGGGAKNYTSNGSNGSNNSNGNKRASFPLSALPALYPRPLKRSSSQSSVQGPKRPKSPRQRQISPRTITTMLSSLLFVMQNYDVHPDTIQYVISQLLRYISFEIFNRMITNKRLLSRTKALQTRLNLSILEDWVRFNHLSREASDQCKPLVQLLQLLQVLSLQGDIDTWEETVKNLDLLTPIQLRRIVTSYRFEVNENRVPSPIKQLVRQTAIDAEKTVKQQSNEKRQQQQFDAQRLSSETDGSSSNAFARRNSNGANSGSNSPVTKLVISNMFMNRAFDDDMEGYVPGEDDDDSGRWIDAGSPLLSSQFAEGERTLARQLQLQREEEEREAEVLSETRNSRSWIPFTIPTNLAEREGGAERVFVPLIPEEMMSLLDTYSYSY